jgi:PAS domain-containing protein
MPRHWRTATTLVLTALIATAVVAAERHSITMPAAPVCLTAVAIATAIGGTTAGLASATVTVLFVTIFVKLVGPTPLTGEILIQLIIFWLAAPVIALAVGIVRSKLIGIIRSDVERRTTIARLAGALDAMDIGVLLLDRDTRAQFINRAFRRAFIVSDELAQTKPPFVALMYHGRDTHAYAMPEEELQFYVAQRVAQVRSADPALTDLRLANGQVLRLRCVAMADGGRMLTYMPITDLIRHTDDPADRDALQALRTGLADAARPHTLRAAE